MSDASDSTRRAHYETKSVGYSSGSERSARVLELVGGPNLRVLDVACGPGHIGAQIRARGNYVVGVEISQAAAAEARRVLNEAHAFDIESAWPEALCVEAFDVIVLGEVLEHVFDPVSLLKQTQRALAPRGRIVITTPNFLVWIARLQLLFGRFRYQRYGLFDFGHIRWFTYDYLRQVVRDAGFRIDTEWHVAHPKSLDSLTKAWPSMFALNFVVSASKLDAAGEST